ncbi:jg11394 [Pararge aegeria aegeria]|uniref:Jg11394 protein n=1 Tax=Pararge aegeria aegeria TaxID=348720 RepID=A0A8S4RHH1_9NEOP|nr:jg11394 [Pararge aegeria aegeria]
MERAVLGVSLHDQIRNENIRGISRITEIAQQVANLKFQRHIAHKTNLGWGPKMQNKQLCYAKRCGGRPPTRWTVD